MKLSKAEVAVIALFAAIVVLCIWSFAELTNRADIRNIPVRQKKFVPIYTSHTKFASLTFSIEKSMLRM